MSVAMSMLSCCHAQQQLLVACEIIKDVHAVPLKPNVASQNSFTFMLSPDAAVNTVASCKIFTFGTVPSTESNLPSKLRRMIEVLQPV